MAPTFPALPVPGLEGLRSSTPRPVGSRAMSDEELREQSRGWWKMHNRACRRELRRRGFTADRPEHLDECRCSWPFVRYDQAAAAVAALP